MSSDWQGGFRLAIGLLPEAMLVLDTEGRVLDANAAASRLLARSEKVLRDSAAHELVSGSVTKVQDFLQLCARNRQFVLAAMPFRLPDGGTVDCRCEGALARSSDEPGTPGALLVRLTPTVSAISQFVELNLRVDALTREVARRTRAEHTLYEEREWMRVTLRSIGDAVVATDGRGCVSFMNPMAEALSQWSGDDARGRRVEEVLPLREHRTRPANPSPFPHGVGEAAVTSMNARASLLRKDGVELPIEHATAPIVDDDGRTLGAVLVFREISERLRAEQTQEALERRLRESQKMQAIGTLAGGIAHDFNNVLGSILTNTAMALEDLSAGHVAAAKLAHVSLAAERARELVRQILTFSRRETVRLQPQVLQALIEASVTYLRGMLPRGVEILIELPQAPVVVAVDATRFGQVMLNLVTNAWHALDGQDGHIRVGLETLADGPDSPQREAAAGPCAHLWVSDDGCGMDRATVDRMFEPFFTTKARGTGTGIGLSVVHGIVAEHRGAITAESAPGCGTTMHIHLPLLPETAAAAPAAEVLQRVPQGPAGAGQRVLYVDDDDVMLVAVQALLERDGYAVTTFGDSQQAAHFLSRSEEAVDLLITDFNMPGVSGLDLARIVLSTRPTLPIIISSGLVSDELLAGARTLGIRDLLNKEETLEHLPMLVRQALSRALAG